MGIPFRKMHGAGNDFIISTWHEDLPDDLSTLARRVCDRHLGIGADGFMVASASEEAAVNMIFYNADGTLAEMCGNGIRCFARYVHDMNLVQGDTFDVETLAGIRTVHLTCTKPETFAVRVAMGRPLTKASEVPIATNEESALNRTFETESGVFQGASLRVGVPHTVLWAPDFTARDVTRTGPEVETLSIFPDKTNVNFAEVQGRSRIRMATWERGAGATLACGTGACATFYVAWRQGLVDNKARVDVPGGTLLISIEENNELIMEGNAVLVAEGFYLDTCVHTTLHTKQTEDIK